MRKVQTSPANHAAAMRRKAMIAPTLNRSASRLDADRNSASTVPATTSMMPRTASRCLQRFRTERMTSRSSARRSMGPPTVVGGTGHYCLQDHSLQESFTLREAIRHHCFSCQEQQPGQEQIPPDGLLLLGVDEV